jgi:hypothetical protein
MQRWRWALAALATVLAAGCAAAGTVADPVQPAATPTGAPPSVADPAGLVGTWHLDAAGEPRGAILTIGDRVDGGLLLFHGCGMFSGAWAANRHGMFVGSLDGGDGSCFGRNPDTTLLIPHWLTAATGFVPVGRDETLVDAHGRVLATLRPGAHATVGGNDSPDYAAPPVVTAVMREAWREPAPLPGGVRPASPAEVQRKWVPTGKTSHAFVTFGSDGRYSGSDGCNGEGGRFLLGADGIVLATSGASTEIGCENNPLPGWVAQAGRLGVRGSHLVFVSAKGTVLGEAARAT